MKYIANIKDDKVYLICEYVNQGMYSIENNFRYNCQNCKNYYCAVNIPINKLHILQSKDRIYAIQNLQSINEQDRCLANLIMKNVEIDYDNL